MIDKQVTMSRWYSRQSIMAIINATPDSFSKDGLYQNNNPDYCDIDSLAEKLQHFLDQGADILDIGAESTRPGSESIPADEQIKRLKPVFSALRQLPHFPVVSLDTSNATVAAFGQDNGVQIINDVQGAKNPDLCGIIANSEMEIVIMHNLSISKNWQDFGNLGTSYDAENHHDICQQVKIDLNHQVEQAIKFGIKPEKIILDPGIGFGKSLADNLTLISGASHFSAMGFPVLVGASRKSFIGKILKSTSDERLEGSIIAHHEAFRTGAHIIRVHDVIEHVRALKIAQAIMNPKTHQET